MTGSSLHNALTVKPIIGGHLDLIAPQIKTTMWKPFVCQAACNQRPPCLATRVNFSLPRILDNCRMRSLMYVRPPVM